MDAGSRRVDARSRANTELCPIGAVQVVEVGLSRAATSAAAPTITVR